MKNQKDKETRYYLDLDLRTKKVLCWDYDQREHIVMEDPANPTRHRVFLTKGQYNKLVKKNQDVNG
jgi:hypothetical protein